jgi:hypothetical protein
MDPKEVFARSSHDNLGPPTVKKQFLMDLALSDVELLLSFRFGNFIKCYGINHVSLDSPAKST